MVNKIAKNGQYAIHKRPYIRKHEKTCEVLKHLISSFFNLDLRAVISKFYVDKESDDSFFLSKILLLQNLDLSSKTHFNTLSG